MNGEVVKLGIHIVSSLGVSKVISEVIKNNTVIETTADKILVNTGTLVLGTMIGGHAKDHVSNTIDNVVNLFKKKDETEKQSEDSEDKPGEDSPMTFNPPEMYGQDTTTSS